MKSEKDLKRTGVKRELSKERLLSKNNQHQERRFLMGSSLLNKQEHAKMAGLGEKSSGVRGLGRRTDERSKSRHHEEKPF